jgi:hypothetical protein
MQLSSNEILAKIPGSWSEVTLDMWVNKLLKLKTYTPDLDDPLTDVYVSLQVISDITGQPMDIVQQFPMGLIKEANKKLGFMSKGVDPGYKPKRKWINKIEDPSFDDFITFVNVSKQLNEGDYSNFPLIVKTIIREPIGEEEILQMPMDEINHGFFLLRQSLKKYLRSTRRDLEREILVMKVNEAMEELQGMTFSQKSETIRRKFKGFMAGTFLQRKSPTGQDSTTSR